MSLRQPRTIKQEGGWLMPVAAFIIVVMGILVAGLANISSQTSVASTQEAITVQAFYAAESGAQYGMNRLFYDTGSPVTRTSASAACNAIDGDPINFSVDGLNNCSTTISCQVSVDSGNTTSFYRIQSDAQCGSGSVTSQRSVQVSAYLQ